MLEQEARDLVETVRTKYPGQIIARFDASKAKNGNTYRVHLTLKPGQKSLMVNYKIEWEGIEDAWQWFLREPLKPTVEPVLK